MTVNEWLKKYGTQEMINPNDPKKCIDELKGTLENKRVFFYGGGR